MTPRCVFCEIAAKREPAKVRYEDAEVLVIDNIIRWAPVMLLAIPKKHLSQEELWREPGKLGRIAVEMGRKHCPNGYRLISNFGRDAMQTQEHAHLHIVGGFHLGPYA